MASIWDFFGTEAGQRRTAALNRLENDLAYYIPPELRQLVGLLADSTQTASAGRAGAAATSLLAPDRTGMERVGDLGEMLSETLGIVAPVMFAKRAAIPAAEAIQEALLGGSVAAREAGRNISDLASRIEVDPNTLGSMGGNIRLRPNVLTKQDAPLIAQHNLSLAGLEAASEMGGIPMPSLAISNANFPLENFGDISLLLSPEKITPRRDLPVWPNDAYTGRQNRGYVDFVNEDATRLALREDPDFGHMGSSWLDSTNDFSDQDYMMRVAQYGLANKIADPKKFDSFRDYVHEVQRKAGPDLYDTGAALSPYEGIAKYGETQKLIYPEDPYTPSGTRRQSKPYSLEEVYRRMNKAKAFEAGSEGHSGPGLLRAVSSDKFKNLDEIKANRGLIRPNDNDMADVKGSWDSDVYYEIEKLANKHFEGQYRSAENFISDLAMGNNVSYANPSADAMKDAAKVISGFKSQVKGMPTEYFEAKPRSVAQLGDFDAALVPEGMGSAIDILKRQGVSDIVEYNDNVPGMSRADKIKQMQKLLFSGAMAPSGLLALQEMQKRANEEQQRQGLLQ